MNREQLKAMGIEDKHLDGLLDAFHAEQNALLEQVQTLTNERETAKAETKKYQKGGELYTDPTELETLRKFKTDTEAAKVKESKDKAFVALLGKLNVRKDMQPIVTRLLDYEKLELNDKGDVSDEYAKTFAEELKAVCPTAFVTPPNGTGINFKDHLPPSGAGNGNHAAPPKTAWTDAIRAKINMT